jgi:Tfp pilus assembly protein PilN
MITINFAARNFRLIALITKAMVLASVVLALTAGAMLWTGVRLVREASIMERTLKGAEAAEEKVKPVLAERSRIVKELGSMSGVLESRRFSWTRFLSDIEAVVPTGVAMKRVDFNRNDGTLSLEGVAQSPEALRNLIVGLERSASFREPFLKHQSLDKGSISFNVVAVYTIAQNAGRAHGGR